MYIDPRTDMVIEFDTHQLFLSDEHYNEMQKYFAYPLEDMIHE